MLTIFVIDRSDMTLLVWVNYWWNVELVKVLNDASFGIGAKCIEG